jgi:hypothetical protein
MRHTISGLVAAIALVAASAAQACGGGLFQGSCTSCGWGYASPCAQPYVYAAPAPVYGCCGVYERLPDPVPHHYADYVHQYYYVNQGPTYTGPGDFAPYPTYQEGSISGWESYDHAPYHYGYAHRQRYAMPRHYRHRMTHEPIHNK